MLFLILTATYCFFLLIIQEMSWVLFITTTDHLFSYRKIWLDHILAFSKEGEEIIKLKLKNGRTEPAIRSKIVSVQVTIWEDNPADLDVAFRVQVHSFEFIQSVFHNRSNAKHSLFGVANFCWKQLSGYFTLSFVVIGGHPVIYPQFLFFWVEETVELL